MYIAVALITGLLVSLADVFLIRKEKRIRTVIHRFFRDTLMSAFTGFGVMKYILNTEDVYCIKAVSEGYLPKFIIVHILCALIWLGFVLLFEKTSFFEKTEIKRKKGTKAIKIISAVLFTVGVLALSATVWGKEYFGDITTDQMIINLTSPTEGTDIGVYISGIEGVVLTTALFAGYFCIFVFSDYKLAIKKKEKQITLFPVLARRITGSVLALGLVIGGCAYGINEFQLFDIYRSYVLSTDFIENNFADPETVKLTFPEEKRNLIHIYLESMENTFLSKEEGGYCDDNLIPHLQKLWHEGISFSHLSEGMGGFQESTGAGWSVASMVNMGTGLPMKVPDAQNQYGVKGNFLPGATTLGDILKEQGYEQTVMFGASADFGGLTHYFRTHGKFTIIDHKEARRRGLIPPDYTVFWGYEDDKLYEFAKDELTRMYETGKPFHFVMETADTHTPEGYLSPDAPTPYEMKYANAVRYSQEQTYNFVRWIQEQPFYENTTVVIIGDHLSMAKTFFESLDGIENYHRSCYNLILNPAPGLEDLPEERQFNRDWAVFDMFPTLLASIGVEIEGDRLGIGTNLFSDKKTVFEQYGVDFVNEELVKRSDFYTNNILSSGNTEPTTAPEESTTKKIKENKPQTETTSVAETTSSLTEAESLSLQESTTASEETTE